jgi:hypothetical protein
MISPSQTAVMLTDDNTLPSLSMILWQAREGYVPPAGADVTIAEMDAGVAVLEAAIEAYKTARLGPAKPCHHCRARLPAQRRAPARV